MLIDKALKRTFIAVLSNNMDISKNIKRVREAKGLSQKEVISAISMGAAQYSRIENGKTDPSVSTLIKIAKALGVSMGRTFYRKRCFARFQLGRTLPLWKGFL